MQKELFYTIFFMSLLLGCIYQGCQKDEEIVKADQRPQTVDTDKINLAEFEGRDGSRLPFDFPVSQTIIDPFTAGGPQTAINMARLDTATYTILDPQAAANPFNLGVTFKKYRTIKYFTDGTAYKLDVWAPNHGNYYIVAGDTINNQLSNQNPKNYITVTRGPKSEPFYDHYFGKYRRRFFYTITGPDSLGNNTITPAEPINNNFKFKYIL